MGMTDAQRVMKLEAELDALRCAFVGFASLDFEVSGRLFYS